jgi:hypothetical protein
MLNIVIACCHKRQEETLSSHRKCGSGQFVTCPPIWQAATDCESGYTANLGDQALLMRTVRNDSSLAKTIRWLFRDILRGIAWAKSGVWDGLCSFHA